jgi:hypothetical protein
MAYETKWLHRGVYKCFSGHVCATEFFSGIAEVQNHPDYDLFKFSINNFLDVVSYDISLDDVTAFVALGLGAQFSNPNMVVAIVATHDGILSLIRNHYEPMAEYTIGYFQCDTDATAWLEKQTNLKIRM